MRYATAERHHSIYAAIADGGSRGVPAKTLEGMAAAFDFSAATLLRMPARTDKTIADLVLESSLPRSFFERMDELSVLQQSALFNSARSSILPVQWSIEDLLNQQILMESTEPPIAALYQEYRMTRGIAFPLSSIDGSRHVLRFDGERPPLAQTEINDLSMLAMHFFEAYDRTRYPLTDDPCGLTGREIEIIHWTAIGKTSPEIAVIMSLSDHTINAYMNNALKKLNCVNRTQLVVKALRMRIIS